MENSYQEGGRSSVILDELASFSDREFYILNRWVLQQPWPEVLYGCECGNLELYYPGARRLECSNECGGIMTQMEPFRSDRLLPKWDSWREAFLPPRSECFGMTGGLDGAVKSIGPGRIAGGILTVYPESPPVTLKAGTFIEADVIIQGPRNRARGW